MNRLTTALLGLTLMTGSGAFAQTVPASTDAKPATAMPKAHKVKKHTRKAPATDATTTNAANPTR